MSTVTFENILACPWGLQYGRVGLSHWRVARLCNSIRGQIEFHALIQVRKIPVNSKFGLLKFLA
jgi:hypothetical protein